MPIRTDEIHCYCCGYRMDAVECLVRPELFPRDGDPSICLNCGALHCFEGNRLRRMKRKERRALSKQTLAQLARMEFGRRFVITEDLAFEQKLKEL